MRRPLIAPEKLKPLSAREKQVMARVILGESNKEIAKLLGTSHRTVELQRSAVLRKMGARNAVELTRMSMAAE